MLLKIFSELSFSKKSEIIYCLLAIIGVLLLGWDWINIMMAYWFELIIIGFFSLLCAIFVKDLDLGNKKPENWFIRLFFCFSFAGILLAFFLIAPVYKGIFMTFAHLPYDEFSYLSVIYPVIPLLVLVFLSWANLFIKKFILEKQISSSLSKSTLFSELSKRILILFILFTVGLFPIQFLSLIPFVNAKAFAIFLVLLVTTINIGAKDIWLSIKKLSEHTI
jgi:hypothetical protein